MLTEKGKTGETGDTGETGLTVSTDLKRATWADKADWADRADWDRDQTLRINLKSETITDLLSGLNPRNANTSKN